MFPSGGGMNFNKLMKQAQEMQKKMAEVQAQLKERIVEASAGGGVVVAKANGAQEIVDVKIDKELLAAQDKEMLEELMIAATNEALKKAKKLAEEEMAKITGMNIPGLFS